MVGKEPELNPGNYWKHLYTEENNANCGLKPCYSNRLSSGIATPYHLRRYHESDYRPRLATPLVQVVSVCVFTHFDDGKAGEIYGSIQAFEGSNPRFSLYCCDPDDSKTVTETGTTLSLTGPDGGAIIPLMDPILKFCLRDKFRGVKIVEEQLEFNPVYENSYDRLIEHVVEGSHGCAVVHYVVFQFAVYGIVKVIVTKTDDDVNNLDVADIYGNIVANYDNGRMFCDAGESLNCLETRLFEKQSDKPLCVKVGTPISLSRNVVVVPAYSSLTIDLTLWYSNCKILARDYLQFTPFDGENPLCIRTENACVEVQVQWKHAYYYLHRDQYMEDSNLQESSKKRKETPTNPNVQDYQHPSNIVVPRQMPPTIAIGDAKTEVFSVFVGGITQNISALCGAIIVDDGSDRFSIYNRDDSSLELLPDNGLASIEVNYRPIQNMEFSLSLYLKDPVANLEVSRGYLSWCIGSLGNYLQWYNKRLCSVVHGDDGYAAVHYEIFADAYEAFVEVKLFADGLRNIPLSLYGTLFGRYSSYDYKTSYEKKYYTNRLFYRARDKPFEVKDSPIIVLLKSIVVVPRGSSLIIEAQLGAFGIDSVDVPIVGTQEFDMDFHGTKSKNLQGTRCRIEVSVEFKR